VTKGHVVGLLVFDRIFTCVSFYRSWNLGEEFVASDLRFVEVLVAQSWGSENGTSEVWRFLKTFGDLDNPSIFFWLSHRLTSFTHALYPSWVWFDPSHFTEVFRSLEVVEVIVDRRKCARANLVVQLRERYRRLITR